MTATISHHELFKDHFRLPLRAYLLFIYAQPQPTIQLAFKLKVEEKQCHRKAVRNDSSLQKVILTKSIKAIVIILLLLLKKHDQLQSVAGTVTGCRQVALESPLLGQCHVDPFLTSGFSVLPHEHKKGSAWPFLCISKPGFNIPGGHSLPTGQSQ